MQNCYNTGNRVPREKQFDQDERLTSKHIQTLQFVQEVVNENKVLKKRIEELEESQVNCDELHKLAEESKEKIKTVQEQYLKRADEINAMMAEKHRAEMLKLTQEKVDQEQNYNEEIVQLRTEVSQVESTNRELLSRVTGLSEAHQKVDMLGIEIDDFKRIIADLKMEIEALKEENERLSGEKNTQFSQLQNLQDLRTQNDTLSNDYKSVLQKNVELKHKIDKLEFDLKEASTNNISDQTQLIENLKNKLAKLHKERSISSEKEQFYERTIGDLKYEIARLEEKLQSAEVTKDRILEEYHKVLKELEYMKKMYSSDSQQKHFKDFVKLKREINSLKDENQELKKATKALSTSSGSVLSLPMLRYEPAEPALKSHGERKKKGGSVKSIKSK